jgi:FkbM family methyltransferase
MSSRHESSTVLPGKVTFAQYGWPPIDYAKPRRVPCFDFGQWLSSVGADATVTIKMDIEGAEYSVLEHMIHTGAIDLVDDLFCEWHHDRFPDIPEVRHLSIVNQVKSRTRLHDWI